jgi:hypothetical protein
MATLIRAELSQPELHLGAPTLAGMPHRIADYAVQFTPVRARHIPIAARR